MMEKYKLNSHAIRADPEFAKRVEKIMQEQKISQRAATFQIEKQLKELEYKLKDKNFKF